jgi:hypothetical protein
MSYSNKNFLIAKQFEMKEEDSFKMGNDLLFNQIFILFSALLKKIKFSVFDTSSSNFSLICSRTVFLGGYIRRV